MSVRWTDERGAGLIVWAMLSLPILMLFALGAADVGTAYKVQSDLRYALETALDQAAQQVVASDLTYTYDGPAQVGMTRQTVMLDRAKATSAFFSAFATALGDPACGSYWLSCLPNQGPNGPFAGPVQVTDFEVYNTEQLVQPAAGGEPYGTATTLLGTLDPSGTVVDRPSVYAHILAPIRLPNGQVITMNLFQVVGANPAS